MKAAALSAPIPLSEQLLFNYFLREQKEKQSFKEKKINLSG